MTNTSSTWNGRRCVVTGGTGFIGSHLCSRLKELGARVTNADVEAPGPGTLHQLLCGNDNESIVTDLAERSSTGRVADTSPEVIFHLAGQPYAPFTTEHPDKAYRDNVVTTANMLEVARAAPGTQFILASSACYFGAAQSSPLREGDPTFVPEHFYTYTKRHAESLVTDYSEFFGVPSAICRFVNVYGPGDRHFGRIIPQLCKQLIELQPESLALRRSAGDSVFEFLYVDDVVSGLLAAAGRRSEAAETYQFGPGTCGRSDIAGLARRLSRIFDGKHRLISGKHLDSERTVTKYLETSKARQVLGWLSEWGLDEGLQDTLDWYSTHLGNIEPAQDGLA